MCARSDAEQCKGIAPRGTLLSYVADRIALLIGPVPPSGQLVGSGSLRLLGSVRRSRHL
jgi:hypothetical protein